MEIEGNNSYELLFRNADGQIIISLAWTQIYFASYFEFFIDINVFCQLFLHRTIKATGNYLSNDRSRLR